MKSEIQRGIALILLAQDYESAIFVALRDRQAQFPRRSILSDLAEQSRDGYPNRERFTQQLQRFAGTLPYPASVNYLGELAGAYVLACTDSLIRDKDWSQTTNEMAKLGYTGEEQLMMVLLKMLVAYGAHEMVRFGNEIIPIQRVTRPDNSARGGWAYHIKLPKQN